MMEKIQRFGGAMFTPVLLFSFAGIMVSIAIVATNPVLVGDLAKEGTIWYNFWKIVENGSWAPSAGKTIKSYVEKWKNIDLVEPVITIRSKAKKADEEKLEALAKTI